MSRVQSELAITAMAHLTCVEHTREEIADVLDVPLGTVKTWIFQARRQLRELLDDAEGAAC